MGNNISFGNFMFYKIKSFLRFFLILLSINLNFFCFSQIDSLMRALDQSTDQKEMVEILSDLSSEYYYIDNDSAMLFASRAYDEAVAAGYTKGEINALIQKCDYYRSAGDNITALELVKQAELLAQTTGDKKTLASVFWVYGAIYTSNHVFDQAYSYYTKALDIQTNLNNFNGVLRSWNKLGIMYKKSKQFNKAIEMYQRVLAEKEKVGENNIIVISALNNIASIYSERGDHQRALELYHDALELNLEKGNNKFSSINYSNLAQEYKILGDSALAEEYFNKALDLAALCNDVKLQNSFLMKRSELLFEQKYYTRAEHDFKEVFAASVAHGWPDYSMFCAQHLALIYEEQNKLDLAFDFLNKYLDYYNVINSERNTKTLTELQFKYNFENEKQLLELNIQQKSYFIVGGLILSVLIISLIITLLVHQHTKAKKAILLRQNLQLDKERLELIEQSLNDKLEMRNKEITTNIIYLQKKNDLMLDVIDTLVVANMKISTKNQPVIQEVISKLRSNVDDTVWKDFEIQFERVYESFYKKLNELNPKLTMFDKRLCAYLRLKMTTKEISGLTNSSVRSVEMARHRIREKLMIKDKSINLVSFLEQL